MTENPLFLQALEDVFNESFENDMKALEGREPHIFSEKHNKKMRKLIKRQRKPYFKLISTAGRRVACIIVAIIVFSASAMSVKAIREAVFDFITKIFSDHNVVTVESGTDIGYPETIETEYYISELPDGFKQKYYEKADTSIDTAYFCEDSFVLFSQRVKPGYQVNYDNEHNHFSEYTDDEGQKYIQITFEDNITFIWDNGAYIFEIKSNLDKNSVLKLCKSINFKE